MELLTSLRSVPRRTLVGTLPVLMGGPVAVTGQAAAQDAAPFRVEARIPLGTVRGRIDHLAVDVARKRVFLAELGNNTLGVVDLSAGAVMHRIEGLREPQGVAYLAGADILLVANGGDGTVHRYRGADFARLGSAMAIGSNADNLRLDPAGGSLVWVGHGGVLFGLVGGGGLSALDGATGQPAGSAIPLRAHPESFQLESGGPRAFVNLPRDGGSIAVLDRVERRQIGAWSVPGLGSNYPMALDEPGRRLFVAFRDPPTLVVLDLGNGEVLGRLPIGGDTDDLFLDPRRRRVYAVCGEGLIDVFEESMAGNGRVPRHLKRFASVPGARTGLFAPELDRLFVAAPVASGQGAALWVLQPELLP